MGIALLSIGGIVMVAIFAAIFLGIDWLLWSLWCWVLPQLWPTGPDNLVNPGFWLFVAAAFLLSCIGRMVFGRKGD